MAKYQAETKKKTRTSTVVLIILIIAAAIGLCVSGFFLIREFWILPAINQGTVDEIQTIAREGVVEDDAEDSDKERGAIANFKKLREVNSDIIGWIRIKNTVIDYPVLQSSEEDPDYYLYRNYKKEDTKYGSIFLLSAASVKKGKESPALLLYGHHMNDGQMFADLLKYSDLDFYKKAPLIQFDTYVRTGDWKVISVFKTNVLKSQGEVFDYNRSSFSSEEDYLDFLYQLEIRSIIDTGVKVNEDDQIVLLSTCSYEHEDFRTVVVARRVREGESRKTDTDKAAYAADPLYPDVWYRSSGGTKPTYPDTFREAKKAGLTDWYDG